MEERIQETLTKSLKINTLRPLIDIYNTCLNNCPFENERFDGLYDNITTGAKCETFNSLDEYRECIYLNNNYSTITALFAIITNRTKNGYACLRLPPDKGYSYGFNLEGNIREITKIRNTLISIFSLLDLITLMRNGEI